MTPRLQVLQVLQEFGPMTAADIHAFHLPEMQDTLIRVCLANLKGAGGHKQVIRISAWVRDYGPDGQRFYLRAVYSVGTAPDAKRPKPLTNTEYNRRYRAKAKTIAARPCSVFDLPRAMGL